MYIKLEEKDVYYAKVVANLMAKASLNIQGEALVPAGESLKWLNSLIGRLNKPEELPVAEPVAEKKRGKN